MFFNKEPKRLNDIKLLEPYVAVRVAKLLSAMRRLGHDPMLFETLRTHERQKWLYGIGRTHNKKSRPVTYTLESRHIVGKAADIISQTKLWNDPKFFNDLKVEAEKVGLHTLSFEGCHVQWE